MTSLLIDISGLVGHHATMSEISLYGVGGTIAAFLVLSVLSRFGHKA